MCGVYRGFYTKLHWVLWNEVLARMGDEHQYDPETAGDRAAVAVGVWEGSDQFSWQREYQGLYRGPNNWVSPRTPGDPSMVADLHRTECGSPDCVSALDFGVGFPVLTVKSPVPGRAYTPFGLFLGLSGPRASLARECRRVADEPAWAIAQPRRSGAVLTLSAALVASDDGTLEEQVIEVDATRGFAPVRYRLVCLRPGDRGTAHEVMWGDLRRIIEGEEVWLPGSMVHWEFAYGHPGSGTLRSTEAFRCLLLEANDALVVNCWPPRLAAFDSADSDQALAGAVDRTWGAEAGISVVDFAREIPPAPPTDLQDLSVEAAAKEIRERYGVR
jgi:hypothetical protein